MKIRVEILLSLVAVVLSACATHEVPTQPRATKAEEDAAFRAYRNCLVPYAKRFDDGRSDAKTIAAAMKGACLAEKELIAEVLSRGDNNVVKRGIRKGIDDNEESFALQVVLDLRRSQSNR